MKKLTKQDLESWANEPRGPVALHLKQRLTSVECVNGDDQCIIYPPTYADIGYNIDSINGRNVALIDSVGSQANRMEPLFKSASAKREDWLVPQIEITLGKQADAPKLSLLDLAHRGADAVVHSSGALAELIRKAFSELREKGDATLLCSIAPTSLVFGVWDSRGGSSEKRPRLVRSIIRAWDVDELHTAAQFNSVWKELDPKDKEELKKEEAKKGSAKLSVVGLADAPGVFYKNSDRRILGGVLVKGSVERTVTINLVALRGLQAGDGTDGQNTKAMRTYLLSLALVAAAEEMDLFLREGCHLRYDGNDRWYAVPRRGEPEEVALDAGVFQKAAKDGAAHFRPRWPENLRYVFDVATAKKLLKAQDDDAPQT